jgi:hypothetical protein
VTGHRPPASVHWPVLELLFEPGAGDELAALVRGLATICRPTAPDHTIVGAAKLLSSPTAPESSRVHQHAGVPWGVVVRRADELDHPIARDAACVVVLGDADLAASVPAAVFLSTGAMRATEVLPVPPFVRQSLRRAHGLPDRMVVSVGRPGSRPLDPGATDTALRVASVVDVTGPDALRAMAVGAPVVTDEATAALLGASHDVHVLVAGSATSQRVADDLAADPVRCARLGRAGRQLVEERHDADRVARLLAQRLGLVTPSASPVAAGLRLGERLAELGTPARHPVEMQLADLLSGLGVAPRTAGAWR